MRLLDSNDYRIRTNTVLDVGVAEACFFHPAYAVGCGAVEAAGGFDEHV
ncbi:MAG: hypothetical protein WA869_10810 [Alloacidobacterium sp.]